MNVTDPLLSLFQAKEILGGCSTATFYRRVADGTIPPPVKIGAMSRWPKSEIEAVIERAKAQREKRTDSTGVGTDDHAGTGDDLDNFDDLLAEADDEPDGDDQRATVAEKLAGVASRQRDEGT